MTLLAIADLLAQATTTAPTTQGTPAPTLVEFLRSPMTIILLSFALLMVFMSRSKNKEKKSRENMLANLKKGDEVQTIGGEFGKVLDVRPDRVQVKVDESSNTKIWYSRSAIHRVVTEEEKAEAK